MDQEIVKINLLGMPRTKLIKFFADMGEKPFRAKQVMQWIHQYGVHDFDEMTNISKGLREKLKTAVDNAVPDYKEARSVYAGHSASQEAITKGQKLIQSTFDDETGSLKGIISAKEILLFVSLSNDIVR